MLCYTYTEDEMTDADGGNIADSRLAAPQAAQLAAQSRRAAGRPSAAVS